MKKILVGLMAVLSVSAIAEMTKDYNISVLGGLNFFNSPLEVKKPLRASDPIFQWSGEMGKMFAPSYVYGNAMIDSMKEKNKLFSNFNLKLELTKNYDNNIEYGLGLAYFNNAPHIYSINAKDFKENAQKNLDNLSDENKKTLFKQNLIDETVKKALKESIEKDANKLNKYDVVFKGHSYNSIPVYATLKYKFEDYNNLTPYVKADLGYSFNVKYKKLDMDYDIVHEDENNQVIKGLKDQFKTQKDLLAKENFKAKNGLYASLGFGVEYNNFLAELSAAYVGGSLIHTNGDTKTKINNGDFKLMTSVGYKF